MSDAQPSLPASQPELTFADIVRAKRQSLRLSCRGLSTRSGLSPAYVTRLERGEMEPSLRAFASLAVELRLSMPEIYFLITTIATRAKNESADA